MAVIAAAWGAPRFHLGHMGRLVTTAMRECMGFPISSCRDADGVYVAVEVKRRGEMDGVEQLTRYLELLNRDHLLGDRVRGVFAAQKIKPQARTLAVDRGIECVTIDYDALRGMDHPEDRLF